MKQKKHEVLGIFKDQTSVEQCVTQLRKTGIFSSQIKVTLPNRQMDVTQKFLMMDKRTKAPECAITGSIVAGLISFFMGGLVGAGLLVAPGLGTIISMGALGTALAALSVGAVLGAIAGWLIGRSIPEEGGKAYERSLNPGEILLSVVVDEFEQERIVVDVLEEAGCDNIVTKNEEEKRIGSLSVVPPTVRRVRDLQTIMLKTKGK